MPTCKQCGINPANGDLCSQCTDQWNEDNIVINWLVSEGHTRHCACRQIWGDGVCSCELEKKYDPYWWTKIQYKVPFTTA